MSKNITFPIRIGSRKSELAIAQANQVKNKLLIKFPEIKNSDIKIVTMQTTGDKLLDKNLSLYGGKGVFTKEIEEALLAKKIDLAVHSMKDVPAILPKNLFIKAILEREEATDAFISNKYKNILNLPQNAVIGTSSIRRKAILLHLRKDLKIIDFRGNINTRLRKLKEQDIDGIILATSGLKRVGITSVITKKIPTDIMIPAIGQGAIGVECREDDYELQMMLHEINHHDTEFCVSLEREFMSLIDGSCKTPIACYAKYIGNDIQIKATIIHPNGSKKIDKNIIVNKNRALATIENIVTEFKDKGSDIIEYIKKTNV
jgi:hydroxymethylbilane synthase